MGGFAQHTENYWCEMIGNRQSRQLCFDQYIDKALNTLWHTQVLCVVFRVVYDILPQAYLLFVIIIFVFLSVLFLLIFVIPSLPFKISLTVDYSFSPGPIEANGLHQGN
jgi:hypothetical protein